MTASLTAAVLALTLVAPGTALAQPPAGAGSPAWTVAKGPIATAVGREVARQAVTQQQPGATPRRRRSATRKVLAGVAGGVGGLFLGGYLGAKIEGHGCTCDDPGLQGLIIGAPIGAIAGAILGAGFL